MPLLQPANLGFRLESIGDLAGWQPLRISSELPLESDAKCPAGEGLTLATLGTFVAPERRLRVGVCPSCGHVAYIDRPNNEWLAHFYENLWDGADRASLAAETERRRRKLIAGELGVEREAITLAKGLPIDRTRPVCEIGCGYGSSLKQLERAGFSNLVGIETSRHRADVVRGALDAKVFDSAFEAAETQAALRQLGPFGLIYAIHSLEHTMEPEKVIAAAADLQQAGDYLIVSVPNLEGEPTVGVLFFLPHLHTFTRDSLVRLAAKWGYGLVDHSKTDARNLNMVFQKACPPKQGEGGPVGPPTAQDGVFDRTLAKFVRGLALDQSASGARRLWWLKRSDRAGQLACTEATEAQREWDQIKQRHADDRLRWMLVSDLNDRRTAIDESPIEIQFAGELTLFYK